MTPSAAWLAVVNWTRECPCIGGISSPHSKLCENCSGTGRVAVLPGLRVPCQDYVVASGHGSHVKAGCPGWLPAPESEGLLLEALATGNWNAAFGGGPWYVNADFWYYHGGRGEGEVPDDWKPSKPSWGARITLTGWTRQLPLMFQGIADTPLSALEAAALKLKERTP